VCFGHQQDGPYQHESQADFHHFALPLMVRLSERRRGVFGASR
jgi:hypothetical protein